MTSPSGTLFSLLKKSINNCHKQECNSFFIDLSQIGRSPVCSLKESVPKSKSPKVIPSCLNSSVSTTDLHTTRKDSSIQAIICHICSLDSNLGSLNLHLFSLRITGNFLTDGGLLQLLHTPH